MASPLQIKCIDISSRRNILQVPLRDHPLVFPRIVHDPLQMPLNGNPSRVVPRQFLQGRVKMLPAETELM